MRISHSSLFPFLTVCFHCRDQGLKLSSGTWFHSSQQALCSGWYTFQECRNPGGGAYSTDHFWLVERSQHFISATIFKILRPQNQFVFCSLCINTSTWAAFQPKYLELIARISGMFSAERPNLKVLGLLQSAIPWAGAFEGIKTIPEMSFSPWPL